MTRMRTFEAGPDTAFWAVYHSPKGRKRVIGAHSKHAGVAGFFKWVGYNTFEATPTKVPRGWIRHAYATPKDRIGCKKFAEKADVARRRGELVFSESDRDSFETPVADSPARLGPVHAIYVRPKGVSIYAKQDGVVFRHRDWDHHDMKANEGFYSKHVRDVRHLGAWVSGNEVLMRTGLQTYELLGSLMKARTVFTLPGGDHVVSFEDHLVRTKRGDEFDPY